MNCPSSEALVAATAPGASPDARERVADHLVACGRCAEEFRVLQEIGPWATDHAHLLGESAPVQTTTPSSWFGRFGSPWAYATAAVLVLAVAGLEVQVQRLQRDNRALAARASSTATAPAPAAPSPMPPAPAAPSTSPGELEARVVQQQRAIAALEQRLRSADAPDLNAPIIDLEPADAQRSANAPPSGPAIPAGARSIVFVLNTAHPAAGALYDVELVGAGNRMLWTGSGLKQSPDGTLTLVVPRALIADATELRLYARAGPRRSLVEQYAVPSTR